MKLIEIPPFDYSICVAIGFEAGNKLFPDQNLEGSYGMVMPLKDENGVEFTFVYLEDEADNFTIWHEALHIVHFMLDARGIPLTVENTEVQAYLQETVVKVLQKEIKKHKRKKARLLAKEA